MPIASNAEIVERILTAWRNLESIPPDLVDPEIEWVNPPDAVESGVRRGRDAVEDAQASVGRAYSSVELDVKRQEEAGDTVAAIVQILYRGRGSGAEVRDQLGFAFTVRDGRVVRFEWSREPEELLERILAA